MKKLFLFLAAILMICLCSFAASAVDISGGGIAVDTDCSKEVSYAADTLSGYLKEITGNDFPVSEKGVIRVQQSDSEPVDGYSLKGNDLGVTISGNGNRGVIYGVYAFLERYCDCKFYTSTLRIIPKNEALSVPDDIDDTYAPFFEYTDTDWKSPRDAEYSLANGLSGGCYRKLTAEQGGTVDYISDFCHTLSTQFCSAQTYFTEHPEYFALHGGKRVEEQLCLTNDAVYSIVLDEVLAVLEEKHDPSAALQIISLTQHDNQLYCECDACAALDNENGAHSGTMITFVNRIAKEVAKRGYDNVAIDTFAYQYTRQAPSNVVPEKNVIVRLCTIECCFAHTLNDVTCEDNAALMKDLSDWSKICSRIYIWDYTTNYSKTLGIFPDFGVLQSNIQTFYENQVKGVYEEGNYYIENCDTEFGELRAYLLSKLMQNPYCDYYAEMDGFLESYYGAGWESIRQFIDITISNAVPEGTHLSIGNPMNQTLELSEEEAEQCDSLWASAVAAVEGEQLENVRRSELSWRFWRASNGKAGSYAKTLYDDMIASGVTQYNEGKRDMDISLLLQYQSPDKWKSTVVIFGAISDTELNYLSAFIYALCLVFAVLIFIYGIKKRKALPCVLFPLMCGYLELIFWHRRAYLSWKDMVGYTVTLVALCILFALVGVCKSRILGFSAKRQTASAFIHIALFIVPYELILMIVNIAIYGGRANLITIALAYFVAAVEFLIILIQTFKATRKNASKSAEKALAGKV